MSDENDSKGTYMRRQAKISFFFLLVIICIDAAFAKNVVRVFAKLYEIPPFQSTIVSAVQNKDRSVSGAMIGGNVTASFPDGMLVLDAYFAKDLPDNAVKEAIWEKVRWPCGEGQPSGVGINYLDKHEFLFETEAIQRGEDFQPVVIAGSGDFYRLLSIAPLLLTEKDLVIKIRFETGFRNISNPPPVELLIERTLNLSLSRILLIGFPSKEGNPRHRDAVSIYWLALSVQVEEDQPN
jgi:hypothetical protein